MKMRTLVESDSKIPTKEKLQEDIDSLDAQIVTRLSALIDELEAEIDKQ